MDGLGSRQDRQHCKLMEVQLNVAATDAVELASSSTAAGLTKLPTVDKELLQPSAHTSSPASILLQKQK
jgi:hypothetical protein